MIADPQSYFEDGCGRCARFKTDDCSARLYRDLIAALRALCLEAGLHEEVRWGHPCYRHSGRNLALIGATRADVRLTLPDAALLDDPMGLLERGGPNSAGKTVIRFTTRAQVEGHAPAIASMLAQARVLAEQGKKPTQAAAPRPALPEELRDAFAKDPTLSQAFDQLSPGRQRSHVLAIASGKAASTRTARIARLRDKIIAGKGATER